MKEINEYYYLLIQNLLLILKLYKENIYSLNQVLIFVDELVVYNNIDNPDFIKAGDTIKLPNMNSDIVTYKIKFGDTFYDICKNYYGRYDHETIDRLAKYNGISKPGEVQAGTVILIPSYEILEQIEIDYTRKLG